MKTFKSATALIETWCLWMAVSSIGWLIGYSLIGYLAQRINPGVPREVALIISALCGGGLLALTQWQYLGLNVRSIGIWTLVSACGLTLGFTITTITFRLTGSLFGGFIAGASGGLVMGFVQWLGLRLDNRDKVAWVLMTILGWAVASGLGTLVYTQRNISSLPNTLQAIVGSWTIGSVMTSLVTVLAMATLFPKSMKKDARTHIRWSF